MATVVAGCKLPHGLRIHLGQKVAVVKTPDPRDAHALVSSEGEAVTLNGSNHRGDDGFPTVVNGFGFTPVDADGIKAWLSANESHPAVKNGLIFIEKDLESAKAEARTRAEVKSGAERLDYDDPMGDKSIEPTKTLAQAKSEAADQQQAATS